MLRDETRAYILKRAAESNIPEARLGLEPTANNEPVYDIAVIYGGALDEDFEVSARCLYEVNIADWLAEMLQTEREADPDHEDWQVLVTDDCGDHGETRYKVTSDG